MMQVGSLDIALQRKAIKNLHIKVIPPEGLIQVSAPENLSDTAIRIAIVQRIPWIKRQQKDFVNQPRQSARAMISGESHYLWGQRYRMEVIERQGKHELRVKGNSKLQLFISSGTTKEKCEKILVEWYRSQLKERMAFLLEDWQRKIDVQVDGWTVRKMRTKWGSCNPQTKRININLELAKKPPECLEFILVHELVHLLERHHNERFVSLMDMYLPNWRLHRDLLKSLPLGHDDWKY
jgi:predicted metal-dependent hydrolase